MPTRAISASLKAQKSPQLRAISCGTYQILQGHFNMKNKKEQWKPKVTCYREINENGKVKLVDFKPSTFTIPAGHSVYRTILSVKRAQEAN